MRLFRLYMLYSDKPRSDLKFAGKVDILPIGFCMSTLERAILKGNITDFA